MVTKVRENRLRRRRREEARRLEEAKPSLNDVERLELARARARQKGQLAEPELIGGELVTGTEAAVLRGEEQTRRRNLQDERRRQQNLVQQVGDEEFGRGETPLELAERFLETEQFPTEQNQLVQPAFSAEGRSQIEQAIRDQSTTRRLQEALATRTRNQISRISAENPEAGLRVAGIQLRNDLGQAYLQQLDRAIVLARAAGDIGADAPFVGFIVKAILGERTEVVNNFKSSLDKRKELASGVATDVLNRRLSPIQGLEALDAHERQLDDAEAKIQQEAILSPRARRSGVLEDIQVTMLQQRQQISRSRSIINQAIATGQLRPDEPPLVENLDDIALRLQELKGGEQL